MANNHELRIQYAIVGIAAIVFGLVLGAKITGYLGNDVVVAIIAVAALFMCILTVAIAFAREAAMHERMREIEDDLERLRGTKIKADGDDDV